MTEHAVLIYFTLSEAPVGTQAEQNTIGQLMESLKQVLMDSSFGEFDGYEFGERKCTIYLYGPNAAELFSCITPLLGRIRFTKGSFARKRYGAPNDPKVKIEDVLLA